MIPIYFSLASILMTATLALAESSKDKVLAGLSQQLERYQHDEQCMANEMCRNYMLRFSKYRYYLSSIEESSANRFYFQLMSDWMAFTQVIDGLGESGYVATRTFPPYTPGQMCRFACLADGYKCNKYAQKPKDQCRADFQACEARCPPNFP